MILTDSGLERKTGIVYNLSQKSKNVPPRLVRQRSVSTGSSTTRDLCSNRDRLPNGTEAAAGIAQQSAQSHGKMHRLEKVNAQSQASRIL